MNASSVHSAQPRLLAGFTPATSVIKEDYEDFVVEELPLYPPCGTGTHTYFLLEKRGLSTMQAVQDIAQALNVRRRAIGYAGLKDARAVTRQWMSVEHVAPEQVQSLQIARMQVLTTARHTNKLHLGHLAGNRFEIKVRRTEGHRLAELQDALGTLQRLGVPNYFGRQRFGGRGDAWEVGRAIVRGDVEEALDIVLGRPLPQDQGNVRRARQLYEASRYVEAGRAWPGLFRDERRALRALQRTGGKKKRAFLAIDHMLRRFYVSAYQSYLFNRVVAERLPTGLSQLLRGDLAWLHSKGAVFEVQDPRVEQPRADAFEISPTGPLFGYRMTHPSGQPEELESQVLASEAIEPAAFRSEKLRVKGERRPLRFQPADASIRLGADQRGAYLELRFTLQRGCYATSLLREIFADEPVVAAEAGETSGTEDPI
jgi:tRNA pseudouridine13 synthase